MEEIRRGEMPESRITYFSSDTGQPVPAIGASAVLLSSAGTSWRRITVEHLRLPPLELPESAVAQHLLTLKLSAPSVLEWNAAGRQHSTCLVPGDVCLTPSEMPRRMRWKEEVEILAVALDPALLVRAAQEAIPSRRIELIATHGAPDVQIQHISLALKAELESGGLNGRLYAESLATALSIHLLRRYNTFSSSFPDFVEASGGLPPSRLRQTIDYIHDHLDQDLSLFDMAAELNISVSRFKLLFKQSVGLAPHQYIIQERVEKARLLLQQGEFTPAQVALQVGFYDQSHLTRHFKRLLGVTPKVFQEHK